MLYEIVRGVLRYLSLANLALACILLSDVIYQWAARGELRRGTIAGLVLCAFFAAALTALLIAVAKSPTRARVVTVLLGYLFMAFALMSFAFGYEITLGLLTTEAQGAHFLCFVGFLFIAGALYYAMRQRQPRGFPYSW